MQPYILEDGSALLLGTRQWLTPEGRLIRKQGISPDYEVKLPIEADLLTPEEIKVLDLEEISASEDTQLLKALELFDVPLVEQSEPISTTTTISTTEK